MGALDQLIVAALLLLPQSYLLWFESREFGAPVASRIWIYAVPGILVAVRWILSPRRTGLKTDPVVVGIFVAVTAVGMLNALLRTHYPVNVLSTYGQQLYWMALAAAFLMATADREPRYLLRLIRRYYFVVAAIGIVYVDVALVAGTALPHLEVTLPGGQYVADNYFVSLAYPEHGIFHLPVARYTFLYREPKVLALHMVIGLILQAAYLWREWSGPRRLAAVGGLLVVVAGFLLANSLFAYIVALILGAFAAAMPMLHRRRWRGLRTLALTAIAVGLPLFVAVLVTLGEDRGAMSRLAVESGKHLNAVRGYVQGIPRALLAAWVFPFGTGSMNLDSPRYETLYRIATSGGTTLVQWAAQNAGILGLGLLGGILWRLLGIAERTAARLDDRALQGVCLGIGCLVVTSTMISDAFLIGAEGTLLVGWLLSVSRTTTTAS